LVLVTSPFKKIFLTHKLSITDGLRKIVPSRLALTPVAIAFWLQDDGSLSVDQSAVFKGFCFHTESFKQASQDTLVLKLAQLKIHASITTIKKTDKITYLVKKTYLVLHLDKEK
jgi:hypothetical protein